MRGLETKCEGWRLRAKVGDYVRGLESKCEGWRVSARDACLKHIEFTSCLVSDRSKAESLLTYCFCM